MRKLKKTLAMVLAVIMLLALLPISVLAADAAYPGQVEWTKPATGVGPNGGYVMQASGIVGRLAPTGGLVPVGGTDGTYFRLMKLSTGGYVLMQADFSATSGTTNNWDSKVVPVAGLNSGVPTALQIDSSGRPSVNLRAVDPGGSNNAVKMSADSYLIQAPAFPIVEGMSATANISTTDSQTIVASSGTAYHVITGIQVSGGAAAGEIVVSIGGAAKFRTYVAAYGTANSGPGLCYSGTLSEAVTITGPASYNYNLHYKSIAP